MHVLIAGGAGFIGSNLTCRLLSLGHRVTVIDNFCTGRRKNLAPLVLHPGLRVIDADITDGLPVIAHVDRVYHLASPASPPGYQKLPVETLRVNSEGTFNLLSLARAAGARFLYASTSEIYGDPLEHPQRETYRGNVSTTGPRSMYDEGKRYGEAMTTAFHHRFRVDTRIVRIFNTYGPNSDPYDGRLVPNFVTQALRGEDITVYGPGTQTRSLCYVDDLVEGLIAAMETPGTSGCAINLGNPEEHTILEFASLIRDLAGRSSDIRHTEYAVGDDPERRRPDITLARELLGWQPQVGLHDGLRRTIEYFRAELAIPAGAIA